MADIAARHQELHLQAPGAVASNLHRLYLPAFAVCFVVAGVVSQVYSGLPTTVDHSPLDYFTGGALWMAAMVCMVMALINGPRVWRGLFWLAGCVALSLLAIDEYMGVHEATEGLVGDDDHSKVFLWALAPVALVAIGRLENVSPAVAATLGAGFIFHTVYLALDVGDGDYFTLPFALTTLQWAEDITELVFVMTYLTAFVTILTDQVRRVRPGMPDRPR